MTRAPSHAERRAEAPAPRRFPVWLVVLAGVGIVGVTVYRFSSLAALYPKIARSERESRLNQANSELWEIKSALNEYAVRNQLTYPVTLELLRTPDENGRVYLPSDDALQDPWGNAYVYERPANFDAAVVVWSPGPDGKRDTDDDIQHGDG